jgi:type III pantothenate kinase
MMPKSLTTNVIAVDIGNSRMKVGQFAPVATLATRLPFPETTLDLAIDHATGEFDASRLAAWCDQLARDGTPWLVASVHRGATDRLEAHVSAWAKGADVESEVRRITYRDLPLTIRVDEPARVGIDRLIASFAADRLRRRDHAAVVVDLGTAITVDLLDAEGAFCGGAILPGIALSARALEEHTDALPRIELDHLEKPPAAVGKSTAPAIEAGLYWGAVGAVRELIAQMSKGLPVAPDVFLTGGASAHVAELLHANAEYEVHHVPHLVLAGIALVPS